MPLHEGRRARLGGALLRVALPAALLTVIACQDVRPVPRGGAAAPAAEPGSAQPPPPPPASAGVLDDIAARRTAFRQAFLSRKSAAARRTVLKEAARYLEGALIDTVLPRWDGTPWAFSGTSTTPRTGSIACGYFLSTTLEEAGLQVERRRLAQQAAEDIIETLAPPEAIARFSDVPVERFEAAVAARGDGLYVVGLDIHVGFLIVRGGEVLFHHSSYVGPVSVVREAAVASSPLAQSRYRVIGKLFTEDALIEAWIRGTPIPTRVRVRR